MITFSGITTSFRLVHPENPSMYILSRPSGKDNKTSSLQPFAAPHPICFVSAATIRLFFFGGQASSTLLSFVYKTPSSDASTGLSAATVIVCNAEFSLPRMLRQDWNLYGYDFRSIPSKEVTRL